MTVQTLEKHIRMHPIVSSEVRWLYTHLPPMTIHSQHAHALYKKVVEFLLEHGKTEGEFHSYLDSVIHFVDEYERAHFPVNTTPEDVLKFLMEQNNLSQTDLAQELGGQPVVSNILTGKRRLTREHIEKLSHRFSVSPASFYSQSNPVVAGH